MAPVILPVSHLQQDNPGECLAACVTMVCTYLGISVTYKHLLKLLLIKRPFGTPAFNIRRVEKLGVSVTYKAGNLQELYTHLQNRYPCIAFLKTGELPYWNQDCDHAVVIIGMDNGYIYLNDPEFPDAPIQVSHGDFDLAWLGRDEFYAVLK